MDIVLIGSGNVASHLGKAFLDAGHRIRQVWSRNSDHAKALAYGLHARPTHQLSTLICDADIYIIAVVDDAIAHVLPQIPEVRGCIVHTSGSTPMMIMRSGLTSYGVFYPLQTFSKNKTIDLGTTPILLEASDDKALNVMKALACSISRNVQTCTSEQRRVLHVAAVFACNFSNHLYVIAQHLLEENGLAFDLIRPLVRETAEKVQHILPSAAQTGPAVRNDQGTLARHREQLAGHPEWDGLYELLSKDILKEKRIRDE